MNLSVEAEGKLHATPVTVFEPRVISPEYTEGQLTGTQRNILTNRIRGVNMHAIAEDLSLPPSDVLSQLYGSYTTLGIAATREDYWKETALTQAALRGVHTQQLTISTFAQNFDLRTGAFLNLQQQEMWDLVLEDNGKQNLEDEIAAMLTDSVDTLGTVTQAQTALIYLAYKRDLALSPAERKIAQYAKKFYVTNKDITNALHLSITTIKTHWRAIFDKLGVENRSQFIDFYRSTPEDAADQIIYTQPETNDIGLQVERLTAAEILVLEQALTGKSSDAIAHELGVANNTVRTHLGAIYRKVGVSGILGIANFHRLSSAYDEAQTAAEQEEPHLLTETEQRILNYILAGISNREIAALFGRSVNTIKTHVRAIYYKVGVSGRKAKDDRQRLQEAYKASANSGLAF